MKVASRDLQHICVMLAYVTQSFIFSTEFPRWLRFSIKMYVW